MFLIVVIRFFGSLHSRRFSANASNCSAKVRNGWLSIAIMDAELHGVGKSGIRESL